MKLESERSEEESDGGLMFYVYLLRSINLPEQTYSGFTTNLKTRFADHNASKSKHIPLLSQ